jgi:hypothetical protein
MTKTINLQYRHFVLIANLLNDARLMVGACPDTVAATVTLFANQLADTNPRFDRSRFIQCAMGNPCSGRDA